MKISPFLDLMCPLDGNALDGNGATTTWRCDAGHSFDIAREGYIHLLPVQNKRSRNPGGSKEMVAARRRFLSAGMYQPIAAAVNKVAMNGLPNARPARCLDAGCGEGYYLRQLTSASAGEDGPGIELLGLDISKFAVLAAARQDKRPTWVVGSNANLPVKTGSIDRVLCIFGFPVYAEFARVLAPEGQLVQVDAGPDHLRELRQVIYPILKPERGSLAMVPDGFVRLSTDTISYSIDLVGAELIADLLAMTPHLFRASAEGRAKVAALTALSVTVYVRLKAFVREF